MLLTYLKGSFIVETVDAEPNLVVVVDTFVSLLSPAFLRPIMAKPLSRLSDKAKLHLTSVDGLVTEKVIIFNIKLNNLPVVTSLEFSYMTDPASLLMRLPL